MTISHGGSIFEDGFRSGSRQSTPKAPLFIWPVTAKRLHKKSKNRPVQLCYLGCDRLTRSYHAQVTKSTVTRKKKFTGNNSGNTGNSRVISTSGPQKRLQSMDAQSAHSLRQPLVCSRCLAAASWLCSCTCAWLHRSHAAVCGCTRSMRPS